MFEINLGWTGMRDTNEDWRPKDPQDFTPVPIGYRERSSWETDMNIDDMMWAMPGDDGEVETEIEMLIGVQPDDVPAGSEVPTAHLRVRLMTHGSTTADEDGEVPEYDSWADSMLEFEQDEAPVFIETIRQNLANAGHLAKTAYDHNREDLEQLTDLDKWHVKQEKSGLEFDWTAEDGQPLHHYPEPLPPEAQMYGMGTGNQMGRANADGIFREIFGYGKSYRFANLSGMIDVSISRVFSAKLRTMVNNSLKTKAKGQGEFDFGEKYKTIDPVKFLADDTDFVIFNKVRWNEADAMAGNTGAYPTISISWLYRMRVGPQSDAEEFEIIKDIATYLNEKPELVTQAANETIAFYVDAFMETINRRKEKVLNNQEVQSLINRTKEIYGGVVDAYASEEDDYGGTAAAARKVWHIATWFEDNYSEMDEIERYIMLVHWLGPMAGNRFHTYGANAEIDDDTGAPAQFAEKVAQQRKAMRRQAPKARNFQTPRGETLAGTIGTPRPAQESVEQQIERIENLLREQAPLVEREVDIRLYKMFVDAKISADRLKKTKQLQDQLRGITNVTTVTSEASQETIGGEWVRFAIKFTLEGQKSRQQFASDFLVPSMNSVPGVEIRNEPGVGWSIPVEVTPGKKLSEISSLQEYGFGSAEGSGISNFGGVVGQLGSQRYGRARAMPTPRPFIQSLIDDWSEGVMGYDAPTDSTDMAYHVMFPIDELLPFISDKEYRGDKKDFDGRYQMFIRNGPTEPVYLAIGQNNAAKVTGGEDMIWFAKKSGLKEVPVFISYQRQV
jgi:hypothetical protein